MPDWLAEHRAAWQQRPALRAVSRRQFFAPLWAVTAKAARGRPVLELGAGPGFLSEEYPAVAASDCRLSPYVRLACRAEALPFADGALGGVVGVDVLHHLDRPAALFSELVRCLAPGARAAFVEPWRTPLGAPCWRRFHHEDFAPVAAPFDAPFPAGKDPMDGNGLLPWQLFAARRDEFDRRWPALARRRVRLIGGWCWALSGGFTGPVRLPGVLARPALAIEHWVAPWTAWLLGLRALIVIARGNTLGADSAGGGAKRRSR